MADMTISKKQDQEKKDAAQARREELILFCPCCFASSDNASWGGEIVEYMCANCGASGPNLKIPRWAVESIRRQASWVGKRFYPHDEDHENYEERMALRRLVKEFPGRSVKLINGSEGDYWEVSQRTGNGRVTSVFIELDEAKTAEQALERARESLPYIEAKKLHEKAPEKTKEK